MPDYNSDREGHTKHKFIVQKAYPADDLSTPIQTSKGELKPDRQGRMTVNDVSLAREIQQQYPRELAVTRMRTPDPADRGHRYHFGNMPALPYAKYDELGRRIWDTEPTESREAQDESPAEEQTEQEV